MQGKQLDLFVDPWVRGEEDVRRALADRSGMRVDLHVTQNRVSMVSIRFMGDCAVNLRMHAAFLSAPDAVLDALARYMRSRNARFWRPVRDFARSIPVEMEAGMVATRLKSCGRVHDLEAIAGRVNEEHFEGQLKYRIGWGRQRPRSRRVRSIRYGSCHPQLKLIRIHPWLDDRRVPEGFVAYIVFHELLHLEVPRERRGERWLDHPPAFRRRERGYPDIERYEKMARSLLGELRRSSK